MVSTSSIAPPEAGKDKLDNLQWAVQSRARNQQSCLRLLTLFETHEKQWTSKYDAPIAQDLIAVAFSLWRAAFLADKTGKRTEVFKDGKNFLETIIRDNAIGYLQDKKCQEWTFNFYTRNARHTLEHLFKLRPDLVQEYKNVTRKPKERWEYCQELLDGALTKFDKAMADEATRAAQRQTKQEKKEKKRTMRKVTRSLTEPDRKSSSGMKA